MRRQPACVCSLSLSLFFCSVTVSHTGKGKEDLEHYFVHCALFLGWCVNISQIQHLHSWHWRPCSLYCYIFPSIAGYVSVVYYHQQVSSNNVIMIIFWQPAAALHAHKLMGCFHIALWNLWQHWHESRTEIKKEWMFPYAWCNSSNRQHCDKIISPHGAIQWWFIHNFAVQGVGFSVHKLQQF